MKLAIDRPSNVIGVVRQDHSDGIRGIDGTAPPSGSGVHPFESESARPVPPANTARRDILATVNVKRDLLRNSTPILAAKSVQEGHLTLGAFGEAAYTASGCRIKVAQSHARRYLPPLHGFERQERCNVHQGKSHVDVRFVRFGLRHHSQRCAAIPHFGLKGLEYP